MRARPEVALRSSLHGIAARREIVSAVLAGLAFGSLYLSALAADSGPRYPTFAIKSYLGRCLAAQAPATTLAIADCDNAADQAFGVEELDPQHRVRLHLAEQCVGAQAMAADAAVRLEPCSDAPTQIFALDGDSIILDANPELVVRLSNAITKPGTPVALSERWLGDDESWTSCHRPARWGARRADSSTVSYSAGFVAALAAAGANTVIQLTPVAELDFQDLACPFEIPAGVTVRGSRRGTLFGPQFWLNRGNLSHADADLRTRAFPRRPAAQPHHRPEHPGTWARPQRTGAADEGRQRRGRVVASAQHAHLSARDRRSQRHFRLGRLGGRFPGPRRRRCRLPARAADRLRICSHPAQLHPR